MTAAEQRLWEEYWGGDDAPQVTLEEHLESMSPHTWLMDGAEWVMGPTDTDALGLLASIKVYLRATSRMDRSLRAEMLADDLIKNLTKYMDGVDA